MRFDRFQTSVSLGDEYDSVAYTHTDTKKYWFPNQLDYRFWEGKKSAMLWKEIDYTRLLDNYHRDFSKLFLIIQAINDKNIIVDSRGKPLYTNKDIAESVGIKYDTTAKTFFRELYNKGILKKDKDKKLVYLSPFVSMRKSRLYIGCYKMFREELRPYLTNKQFCDLERHLEECLSLGQV